MTYQAKNNAYSTLAGALTNVATSLTVQPGHGDRFPVIAASNYTMVTLEDASGNREIVKVSARAGASDTMTIARAQEGTTARAWAAGDSVELRMTAAEIQTVFDHVDDSAAAHAASAISNTPSGNMAATTVQGAIDELQTDLDTREKSINAATEKTTPVDADTLGVIDSAASNALKKVTWANIKATLKSYFDSLYAPASASTAISDHISDATAAHAASAISYGGNTGLSATDVEAALDELDNEKLGAGAIGTTVQAYDADIPTVSASQAEMEAGTEVALRSMSPSRIKQAILALTPNPESMTLLGTLTTTSGTTQTLSSLTLAGYKHLFIVANGVNNSSGAIRVLRIGGIGISVGASVAAKYQAAFVELSTGVASGAGNGGNTGYSTATTSIVFDWDTSSTFNNGSIKVYGVK